MKKRLGRLQWPERQPGHNKQIVPQHLFAQLHDKEYLTKVASRLLAIAAVDKPLDQQGAFIRIFTWEIGKLDVGGTSNPVQCSLFIWAALQVTQ